MDYEDPGWRPALSHAIPYVGVFFARRRRKRAPNALISMRGVFLSLIEGMIGLVIPLAFITNGAEPDGWRWFAWVVVGGAIVTLGTLRWLENRLLGAANQAQLAGRYRTMLFIDIGRVNAIAMLGFVGVFLTGRLWIYLLGLGLALVGFAMIAPTRANIERIQRRLDRAGPDLSLGRALTDPGSSS